MTDDQVSYDQILIEAMFGSDPAFARKAKELYDAKHASDPVPAEPRHCAECFEGCPKCQPVPNKK